MAAWTYRASGAVVIHATGGNIDLSGSAPAGVQVGDLLLLFTGQRGSCTAVSLTAGWTLLATNTPGASGGAEIYGRFADGSAADAPSTVDWDGTSTSVAHLEARYGGGYATIATIAAHVASESGNASGLKLPPFTPATVANCLVVGYSVKNNTLTDATTISHSVLTKRTQYVSGTASRVHAATGSLQQTTAVDYDGTDFTVDGTAESLASRGVVVYLKTLDPAPTFDSAPTVSSQTAAAYTIGYDADANATNIYVGAYTKDATAPTASELKAGTGALATATEATTGSADSIVLTPTESPAFPLYDLYAVLEGAGGFSSVVALVDEYLDAPTGKQFTTLTSLDATSPFYGTGAAVGDVVVTDTATDPGAYVVTCGADGTVSYSASGDTSRQLIAADVYDVSAGAYLGAGTLVYNNLAPDPGGYVFAESLLYQKSVAITDLDLLPLAPDPDGDTVTPTAQTALPPGLSVTASGQYPLTGTPTTYGSPTSTLRWTDQYGAYYEEVVQFEIGDLVPDVVGVAEATAIAAIEAVASMTAVVGSSQYSLSVAEGNVISQDPAAGTLVAPDQVVTLVISFGSAPNGGGIFGNKCHLGLNLGF